MKARIPLHLAVVVLLVALGTSVGCSKKPNDASITGTIQSNISADSGLQGKQLAVESSNGVVTLTGTVDNEGQRSAAARYAAAVPGVTQVINNLQVAGGSASNDQPQAEPVPNSMRTEKPVASRRSHASSSYTADTGESASQPPVQLAQSTTQPAAPPAPATPAAPPVPQKVTIPSGTTLAVRLVDELGSDISQQGQTFRATLNSPLAVDGDVVVPAGYDVEGHVVEVENGGKFTGKSQLTLQLDRIAVGSKYYNIQTDTYHRETNARGKNTATKVGAGTVIGAIIGGIAGGGKGAAIGAATGGGVGAGAQAVTKAPQVKLPSEFVLNFTLQSSVTVTPTTKSPREGHPRLSTTPAPSDSPETTAPEN